MGSEMCIRDSIKLEIDFAVRLRSADTSEVLVLSFIGGSEPCTFRKIVGYFSFQQCVFATSTTPRVTFVWHPHTGPQNTAQQSIAVINVNGQLGVCNCNLICS